MKRFLNMNKILFLMLFALKSVLLFGQNSTDPLLEKLDKLQGQEKADLLNQISKDLRDSDRLSSMNYAKKAFQYSEDISYEKGQALALKNEGIIWFYLGKNDSAYLYYKKSYVIYLKIKDLEGQSACLNNLGLIKQETGSYNEAVEFYNKSIAIDQKLNDEVSAATTMMNIGEVLMAQGKTNKAIDIMNNAYEIFERNGDIEGVMNVLNNRAGAYDNLLQYNKALSDINQFIALAQKYENRYYEARGLSNKALYLFHLGKITEAREFIDASLALGDENEDGYGVFNTYLILADILTFQNKYEESNFYLQKVLKQAEEMGHKKKVARAFSSIGRNLMEMNEIDKAKGYFGNSLAICNQIGAEHEILFNLYNLSIIEALMRNFKSADSLNELYTQKAIVLFGNEAVQQNENTEIELKQTLEKEKGSLPDYIFAICSLLGVLLLSIIAFKK